MYGHRGGLKSFSKHATPHLNWVGCGNHKLALCFKHLLQEFASGQETDVFLKTSLTVFQVVLLGNEFVKKCAEIYGESIIVPVTPSITQWTAHERACTIVNKEYHQFVSALVTCYNERKELEALGLFK